MNWASVLFPFKPKFLLVLFFLVIGALMVAFNYSYSDGNRAGYIQKFSKKGWLCKTYEGEIAMVNLPGQLAGTFEFTVRDDSIAALINKAQGQRVAVSYAQHKGLPTSCFGETDYFVKGVKVLGQ